MISKKAKEPVYQHVQKNRESATTKFTPRTWMQKTWTDFYKKFYKL